MDILLDYPDHPRSVFITRPETERFVIGFESFCRHETHKCPGTGVGPDVIHQCLHETPSQSFALEFRMHHDVLNVIIETPVTNDPAKPDDFIIFHGDHREQGVLQRRLCGARIGLPPSDPIPPECVNENETPVSRN